MVGGRHANLVAVLKPTARVSKTLAIDLTYREGGTQYRMQTHYPLLILIGRAKSLRGQLAEEVSRSGSDISGAAAT